MWSLVFVLITVTPDNVTAEPYVRPGFVNEEACNKEAARAERIAKKAIVEPTWFTWKCLK